MAGLPSLKNRCAGAAFSLALCLASGAVLADTNAGSGGEAQFKAVRGDRYGGWLAQSRSEVLARNGIVATSQPLASQAGLDILKKGGNAVDAAIAAAAVLNVVEPGSAGIGGDMFALVWLAKEHKLIGLNGSGRSPSGATLDYYAQHGRTKANGVPEFGILSVSVPGAVDGWDQLLKRAGTMGFRDVLEPAAEIAETGFGVSERIHNDWASGIEELAADPDSTKTYLVDGKAPATYSIFKNPDLARAFRVIETGGRDAYYTGEIAKAIVAKSTSLGGTITMQDLADTHASWVAPITTNYHGYDVYELPPNTQGYATLEMLNILDVCAPTVGIDLAKVGPASAKYWHFLVEAKKLAYADLVRFDGDPDMNQVPVDKLISKDYARTLCKLIDPAKARPAAKAGNDIGGTVYVTAADRWGNMVSLIYSVYDTFGSGVTVPGYGFVLQDRGALFSLDPASPNVIAPHKRPFHTLIPAFLMKDGKPLMSFGLMGGDQQAQGHAQVLVDMIDLGVNPQAASDAARFRHAQFRDKLHLESGLFDSVGPQLQAMGHKVVKDDGADMGGFQAIWRTEDPKEPAPDLSDAGKSSTRPLDGVYRGASDHRKDGEAVGW